MPNICDDCRCNAGELHEAFCTRERCPFCGSQLVSCGCISEVLQLNYEQRDAVDEYIDDEVEPLRSINIRWLKALNEKGRVPY
jgi:hypothetical protein